jgi:hypothetical protein
MAEPDDVEQQRALLQAYRRSLALLLEQLAQHGSAFAPPALLNNISEARAQIQHIKTHLRQHGIAVEDHLIDSELARERPARGATRPVDRVRRISAAVLAILLVLGVGMWWVLSVMLRPSSAGLDPGNWSSLVRVTSAAFLDLNTCWLAKELPETIHPDSDPMIVQDQIKQIQDARRVPIFTSSNGITIPVQVTNIVKDGEKIALEPKW